MVPRPRQPLPGVVPCCGLREAEWAETHRRCTEFVERWGMQARAAGWGTTHLFGASPDLGAIRGDWKGHLVPLMADVTDVTNEWIRIGNCRSWRLHPVKQQGMIPIWESKQ